MSDHADSPGATDTATAHSAGGVGGVALIPVDGRRARRDRNRLAALEAAIELFQEGHAQPRLEQVAERSGVSVRSLYRYFADSGNLLRAAMDHHFAVAVPVTPIRDVGEGPLDERIERCVTTRMGLHEGLAPMIDMVRVAQRHNEIIRSRWVAGRELLRTQVERHFAPELDLLPPGEQAATATALDVLCQLETIHYLRADRGLSVDEATSVVTTGLRALLAR